MSTFSRQFLITGATGGLGAQVLHELLHEHKIPASSIIAISRSEKNRERFESQGLCFAAADYAHPESLDQAFQHVENLLFVSSPQTDTALRDAEHANVIAAAKRAGVKTVWYVSLAFGGYANGSKIFFQQSHYRTEDELLASGLSFISLRCGVYSDAFPLFLNWYPSSTTIRLPALEPPLEAGKVSWTSRAELGAGIAALLAKGLALFPSIKPVTEKNIILLTSKHATSLLSLVNNINGTYGHQIKVEYLEPKAWVEAQASDDMGCKSKGFFEAMLGFYSGVSAGDAETTDPALAALLTREPETGNAFVQRVLNEDRGYTWHQNYNRK